MWWISISFCLPSSMGMLSVPETPRSPELAMVSAPSIPAWLSMQTTAAALQTSAHCQDSKQGWKSGGLTSSYNKNSINEGIEKGRMGTSKWQKSSYQLESIREYGSVSHTKLCADIIKQGRGFLDDIPSCHTRLRILLMAKTNSCDIRGLLTGWNWTVKQCATPCNQWLSNTSTLHIMTAHQSEIQPVHLYSKWTRKL